MSRRKLTFAVTFLLVSAALLGMAASAQAGSVCGRAVAPDVS